MGVEKMLAALDRLVPGGAQVLIADAVWDTLYPQYIVERDALVAKALDPAFADAVRKAALRTYRNSGAEPAFAVLDDYAQIVEVAKANEQIQRDGWVQYVRRDEKGRFSRTAVQGRMSRAEYARTGRKIPNELASAINAQRSSASPNNKFGERSEATETYLHNQMQLLNLTGELQRRLPAKTLQDTELVINYKNRDRPSTVLPYNDWKSENLQLSLHAGDVHSFELRPTSNAPEEVGAQIDALNAVDILGRTDLTARQMAAVIEAMNPQAGQTRATKLSQTLAAAGGIAGGLGAAGAETALRNAARGVEGGEALRPALTRAAYRYRGVEKPPERQFASLGMSSMMKPAVRQGEVVNASDINALQVLGGHPEKPVGEKLSEVARRSYATERRDARFDRVLPIAGQRLDMWDSDPRERPMTGDQLRNAISRDLVAQELVRRQTRSFAMRSKESELEGGAVGTGNRSMRSLIQSIASGMGRDLPSEGIVIGADGEIAQQAVGVGGDHYQPFNIKGRRALDGGQYVRTRQLGGITSDDLRTMLTSNARAATVVSASGVFDIELDPSFRNQARMSERALGMVDTYERILDQLTNSQIYARDLDPHIKAEVHVQAARRAKAVNRDEGEIYNELIAAKRAEMTHLTPKEMSSLKDQAMKEAVGTKEQSERYQDLLADAKKQKVRQLNLNSEGYEVALRTLQTYYPYFIRDVSRRDLKTFMAASNDTATQRLAHTITRADSSTDQQYVKPGSVRSGSDARALTGLPKQLRDTNSYDAAGSTSSGPATGTAARPGSAPPADNAQQPPGRMPAGGDSGAAPSGGGSVPPWAASGVATETSVQATATPMMLGPVMAHAKAAVENNAKEVYGSYTESLDDELKAPLSTAVVDMVEECKSEPDTEDWESNAFTTKRKTSDLKTDSAIMEGTYLARAMIDGDTSKMKRISQWISGDFAKYKALESMIDNNVKATDHIRTLPPDASQNDLAGPALDAMRGAAMLAYAASLAGQGYRTPDSEFDGRPAPLEDMDLAQTPDQVRELVRAKLQEAAAPPFALVDPAKVDSLAGEPGNYDELEGADGKIPFQMYLRQRIEAAQRFDNFLKGKTLASDGTPYDQADAAEVGAELANSPGMVKRDDLEGWLWMRGVPSTGDIGVDVTEGLNQDPGDVEEAAALADTAYSAVTTSLALDVSRIAARALIMGGGGEGSPKELPALKVGAQDSKTPTEAEDNYKAALDAQWGVGLINRIGKSLSPQVVHVDRLSNLAHRVRELVAKGLDPQAAAACSVRSRRRVKT